MNRRNSLELFFFFFFFFLQDPQPSPLALLAATCSKIGHPGSAQQGQQQIKVIGPQGQVLQAADLNQLAGKIHSWQNLTEVADVTVQHTIHKCV